MPEHLTASLLIALIGGVVDLDSTATWQFMISQPIVAAPLTGLFLGNMFGEAAAGLKLGLMVGTILQLIWIEQLPLGMNVPPDAALASVLSVALGFIAGHSYESYSEREVCYTIALLLAAFGAERSETLRDQAVDGFGGVVLFHIREYFQNAFLSP